jgi:hypothetical protein
MGRGRVVAGGAACVAVAAAFGLPEAQVVDRPPQAAGPVPAPSVAPPVIGREEANRQDRVGRAHRKRETRAFDGRPLLAVLPLKLGGVRIAIAGLAPDGRTAILEVSHGQRAHAYARRVYERALAAVDDDGTAYRVRWRP